MKKIIICLLSVILAADLAGCSGSSGGQEQDGYYLYYLNQDLNQVTAVPYEPEHSDTEGLLAELAAMQTAPAEENEHVLLLPEGTSILNYHLEGETLTLNMSSSYGNMSAAREILARAGLVRTFVQVEGVTRVEFQVNGSPLTDSYGNEVGTLTENSFVENSGKELNTYQNITMQLYFTDESGTALVPEERVVYYSSNVPLERVVVEDVYKRQEYSGPGKRQPALYAVRRRDRRVYYRYGHSGDGKPGSGKGHAADCYRAAGGVLSDGGSGAVRRGKTASGVAQACGTSGGGGRHHSVQVGMNSEKFD